MQSVILGRRVKTFTILAMVILLLATTVQLAFATIQVQSKIFCINNQGIDGFGRADWWNEPSGRTIVNETQLYRFIGQSSQLVDSDVRSGGGTSGNIQTAVGGTVPFKATYAVQTTHKIFLNGSFSGSAGSWDVNQCGLEGGSAYAPPTFQASVAAWVSDGQS